MIRGLSLSIAAKQLAPGDSLGEVMFGLIMTLTFTLGAGLIAGDGANAARQLLIATVGCNLAWGIIDAAFYLSGQLFERARIARLGERIRHAKSEEAADAIVERELVGLIGIAVGAGEWADVYRRIARQVRTSLPRPPALQRADLYGALASFWLAFLPAFRPRCPSC